MNRLSRTIFLPAIAFAIALAWCGAASAQDGGEAPRREAPRNEINYEVQLHLLVTAGGAEAGAKVPQTLDGVVRQLKSSLPPAEYRLAATFINRVKDGGRLEVKTVGGSPFTSSQLDPLNPTFFQFFLGNVKMADDQPGSLVNVQDFRLGLKVPVQTATVSNEKTLQGYPVIQYEDTGINTQMSVREGEPTLVGTLNTSRPGQLFALVITIRRTGK